MNRSDLIESIIVEARVIKPNVSFVKPALNKVKSKLINKDLGNLEIDEILNKAFSSKRIKFTPTFSQTSADPKYAQIYLTNASTLEDGSIQIEYENDFWKLFDEDDYYWDDFVKGVEHFVEHEMIHREQMKRIKKNIPSNYKYQQILRMMEENPEETSKYLSRRHELMSFAKESVTELRNDDYSDKKIKQLIKRPFTNNGPSRGESHIFWTYTEWFDSGDKVLKQFLKYMYGYLNV